LNSEKNLGMNIISANGHPEAFQMVETGRAVAFVMDDILLAGLIANSRSPGDFEISKDYLSLEPYGAMLRKDDPEFQKVCDDATAALYKSPQMAALYDKWFMKPIPPKNVNLNVPMSEQLKKALANPTRSGDPNVYK
jgi:glutamate/aspartate transport system substrate-binding protein